ncbi:MAG: N-acetyltransferase [Acetivibrionales bacterium]|jgi:GNAT superfamily N-acetyltransferase
MSVSVISVRTKKDLAKFIKLPWIIYKGNKCWVPPLIKDMKQSLDIEKNKLLKSGEHCMFLAIREGKPVGRIYTGIDKNLNQKKNSHLGYFSLFECINDYETAKALFDTAVEWFRENKINRIFGPVSTEGTDTDENKGLLIDAFNLPPVLMNSYNPPYYKTLIEKYGFEKDYDLFAYYLDREKLFNKNPEKIIEYAKKKYNFSVDTLDMGNLNEEIKAIKHVLDLAVPDEWEDMVAPTIEDVNELAKKLIPVVDPDLVIIARSGSEAVGFGIALPDYNQILVHINGRITPLAALKYLWYKKRINRVRFFIMFVVPEFRKKGVSYAIYYQTFLNGIKKGFIYGEGSTIGENNTRMRNDIESLGGEKYKTYRIFKKEID